MYIHVYIRVAYVCCVFLRQVYVSTRSNHTRVGVLTQSATFVDCPEVPGLLEMSFRVLYDAVHDVALNPEMYVQWCKDFETTGVPSTSVATDVQSPTFTMERDAEQVAEEWQTRGCRRSIHWPALRSQRIEPVGDRQGAGSEGDRDGR